MGDARKCCSAWGRLSDSTPLKQQNSDLLRRARLQQRLTTLPRSQLALGNAKCPRNFVASAWGEAQLRRQVRSQVQLGNEKHCKRHYTSYSLAQSSTVIDRRYRLHRRAARDGYQRYAASGGEFDPRD